ncbi:hypothetical protein [Tunturiibacter gelidoferens]|uniref:Uncharacterized protein n=1 Tax=Tunturiibacter gelidiferens TaxID=3069689 RepID=A0A9X0U750_9BACT|nr:hypothetical protein [Edaphobacter lichenicola]MBB5330592.1 hypothetical protein [Edaphobacter lichenicola]
MAIIRAKGLYEGERLRACTDAAQLHWPRLYLLGNGHSRFERDYERIIAVVYASFHTKPTAEDVRGWLGEYADNFLLFLYEDAATGAMWAQWITAQENLANYRTAEDKRSPAPDEREIDAYRRAYIDRKRFNSRKTKDILKPLEIIANHFPNPQITSVGVGDGDGVGRNKDRDSSPPAASEPLAAIVLSNVSPTAQSADADDSLSLHEALSQSASSFKDEQHWELSAYLEFWNAACPRFKQAHGMTDRRVAKLQALIGDGMTTQEFMEAVRKVASSTSLHLKLWKPNFEWFLSEDNWSDGRFVCAYLNNF